MDTNKYWIDDDGYIAHGKEDDYTTVSGQIDPLHIEPLTRIIDSHTDLLETCKNFREWWADHFEDFDDHCNGELLCLDNDCEAAIAKATN